MHVRARICAGFRTSLRRCWTCMRLRQHAPHRRPNEDDQQRQRIDFEQTTKRYVMRYVRYATRLLPFRLTLLWFWILGVSLTYRAINLDRTPEFSRTMDVFENGYIVRPTLYAKLMLISPQNMPVTCKCTRIPTFTRFRNCTNTITAHWAKSVHTNACSNIMPAKIVAGRVTSTTNSARWNTVITDHAYEWLHAVRRTHCTNTIIVHLCSGILTRNTRKKRETTIMYRQIRSAPTDIFSTLIKNIQRHRSGHSVYSSHRCGKYAHTKTSHAHTFNTSQVCGTKHLAMCTVQTYEQSVA